MKNLKYYVHYIFENETLETVYVSNSKKVFTVDQQIIELSVNQLKPFMKTVSNVTVQWDNDIVMPYEVA